MPTEDSDKTNQTLMKICICSTIKHPPNLKSWIEYHLFIGVSAIYIYFDDPDDSAKEIAADYPQVRILDNIDRSVDISSRLDINLRDAIIRAKEDRMDWIIHIDDDELLCPLGNSLQQIFNIPNEVCTLIFPNHEVLKTKDSYETYDYFREEEYFFYRGYLSYQNGKSAGNLSHANLEPRGQHRFGLKDDPEDIPYRLIDSTQAAVLHYPFCIYEGWKEKCQRDERALGNMEYYWIAREQIEKIGPFNEKALRDIYAEYVHFSDEKRQMLMNEGKVLQIDEVAKFLRRDNLKQCENSE